MDIFIIRDGKQAGPYSEGAVQSMMSEGGVRPTDMGWRKGLLAWLPLSEVLKSAGDRALQPPELPAAKAPAGANGSQDGAIPVTAKQKALLKYLGVDLRGGGTKEIAAVVISDALEDPKLQGRLNKWNDEKLRLHPDVFQDEINFRKAGRTARYLERVQTEGAEMVRDVTKAHVQVLVESLDKRFPNWEADSRGALWDYLLPLIGENFPQLMLPASKGQLRLGGVPKVASVIARKPVASTYVPPPAPPSTFWAAARGMVYGLAALGLILGANHYLNFWPINQGKPVPPNPAPVPSPKVADVPKPPVPPKLPEIPAVVPKLPEVPAVVPKPLENPLPKVAENPPVTLPPLPEVPGVPAPVPVPVPVPVPAPPMAEEKPAPVIPVAPAPKPVEPPAPVAPAAPRTAVVLTQGVSVMLANGQVTLPAGTQLRYLALEGTNVRVSWNNSVFYVPAVATDLSGGTPPPAPPLNPAPAAVPPVAPGAPALPQPPKKAADDL